MGLAVGPPHRTPRARRRRADAQDSLGLTLGLPKSPGAAAKDQHRRGLPLNPPRPRRGNGGHPEGPDPLGLTLGLPQTPLRSRGSGGGGPKDRSPWGLTPHPPPGPAGVARGFEPPAACTARLRSQGQDGGGLDRVSPEARGARVGWGGFTIPALPKRLGPGSPEPSRPRTTQMQRSRGGAAPTRTRRLPSQSRRLRRCPGA